MLKSTSTVRAACALAVAGGFLACDGTPSTGPLQEIGNDVEFFAPITFSELQDNARSTGALTVEIDLLDGSLVAREVAIQFTDGETREEINSRVTAISSDGATGSMTVALGDLIVSFNAETKFLDGEENEMSFETFTTEVAAAVAAESEPTVWARRAAPSSPQAPEDATFLASEIRLNPSDEDESRLILNVDLDNLLLNDAPPPDAWIHALNLMIELRVSEGITRITIENPEFDRVEFEGIVGAVDLTARSVTLDGGVVVRLVDDTKIRFEDGHHKHLPSLEAVQEAMTDGRTVIAYGVGVLESSDPRTIVAIKVAFVIRPPPMERFYGKVLAIDLEEKTLTLNDNVTVRVDENTHIRQPDHEGDMHHLGSLEAAAAALEDGKFVEAGGKGIVESEAEGGIQILAAYLVMEVELPPTEGFEGIVSSVNTVEGTLTVTGEHLDADLVVNITEDTKVVTSEGDEWRLSSLAAVAEAIEADRTVKTHGRGFVVSEDPPVMDAVFIAFHVEPPDLTEFEGVVSSVNAEEASLTLESGLVIRIDEETRFKLKEHHFDHAEAPILDIVQRVLDAGVRVVVSGAGVAEGDPVTAILAVYLVFHFEFVGEMGFEGAVQSVDVEAQTFKLENGLTVHIVDQLTIDVAGDLTSLAAVAEALTNAEVTVHAEGRAVLLVEGDLVKAVAVFVRFET